MHPAPQLCVHRAADTIGGNCVEIVSVVGGTRLLLDAGMPLDADVCSGVSGAEYIPASLDLARPMAGVLISHAHPDHCGLLAALPAHWPVYSGPGTRQLAALRTHPQQPWHEWRSGQAFMCGCFCVIPHLVDHSGFDAYALEIAVDGKKIFYSGDFRNHGRKAACVNTLMTHPPTNIDVLLMEGTNLLRAAASVKPTPTEDDLQQRFLEVFSSTSGRVFVTASCSNIDRIVTVYRACLRANRTLVIDLYTAYLLSQIGKLYNKIPQAGWNNIRVVVTNRIKNYVIKRFNQNNIIDKFVEIKSAIRTQTLNKRYNRWVIMVRESMLDDFSYGGIVPTSEDAWVWSLWDGYGKETWGKQISEFFKACRKETLHTSGHASPKILSNFAISMNPKMLIPVHGEAWREHTQEFPNVRPVQNGEWISITGNDV